MSYSGILRRIAHVRADISEEIVASIIRAIRRGELGTTLAITSNRSTLVIIDFIRSSETSVLTRVTRRNILKDGILHSHPSENLKSYMPIKLLPLRQKFRLYLLLASILKTGMIFQRSRVRFPALPNFLISSGSGTGSTLPLGG
jgi:hypothetical protein